MTRLSIPLAQEVHIGVSTVEVGQLELFVAQDADI
jgi:hypothetical protein